MINLFTRRLFLRHAPIAAVAASALAIRPEPAVAEELPVDKVNRLGWELAEALNSYADGRMHAEIYPSEGRKLAVGFVFDFEETQEEKVKRLIKNLQYEMSMLPIMETAGGGAHEIQFEDGGYLRLGCEDTEKDDRLVVVGFVPPLRAGRSS